MAGSLKELDIIGNNMQRYLYSKKSMRAYLGKKRVKFNCRNLFKNKKKRKPILLAYISSPSGFLDLDGNKFMGKLLVATNPRGDSCDVINQIDLENYLSPLLSKEMHGSWPLEALKAQAVAARSYAAYKMKSQEVSKLNGHEVYYDLESSEKHQVSGTFNDATKKTIRAQKQTIGQVLVEKSDNILRPIFFHAESGGRTFLPEEVWNNSVKGYYSVERPYAESSIKWNSVLVLGRLRDFLNWYLNKKKNKTIRKMIRSNNLRIVPDLASRSVVRMYLGDQAYVIRKTLLRRFFGRKYFQSNTFRITLRGKLLIVKGYGSGHGVGMSQIGAKRLAERGWDYKRILSYYYPGYKLKVIY